ncbi:response regulator [Phreatobacter oligotrophus]|uniref:Two-component system KDP operon response regulator KdpE n=1 Tax=Phreatobacter oligotrophus TaxID=1122261 RepID=A0A2T4ZH98_9HYPH|nr:response regulator transcription factor [Phreatobacter oligotrophus]PTM61356.1 two-component system KDP operon response regulator KdpE [Phreatobacter oligotrophus]
MPTTSDPGLVLLVDDEPPIRRLLRTLFEMAGWRVAEAETAGAALDAVAVRRPELVVLDLGLPDIPGADVLRRLREWTQTPVIVLSVRADEQEKVRLLELGADDYITKPFGSAELIARARTVLRRAAVVEDEPAVTVGDLTIDFAFRRVTLRGEPVTLARKEYQLLAMLAAHRGRVLTHKQLLTALWGPHHDDDVHYVRILVRKLRSRIEPNVASPIYVLTELGVGYRLALGTE